jgi:biopolymer transport protein ExbD
MPVKLQSAESEHEEEARIEIVPLIDIMFFLLASFMMVSLSMTQIHRVNLKLPTSSSAVSENKVPPVHLAIDEHGVITWDGKIVTPTEITQRLVDLKPDENTRVLIGADQDCRHQHVLSVLDAVKAAKIEKVSFETKIQEP